VVDNGVETVTVEEDGQLKSKTVNGVAVPVDNIQREDDHHHRHHQFEQQSPQHQQQESSES